MPNPSGWTGQNPPPQKFGEASVEVERTIRLMAAYDGSPKMEGSGRPSWYYVGPFEPT